MKKPFEYGRELDRAELVTSELVTDASVRQFNDDYDSSSASSASGSTPPARSRSSRNPASPDP